MWLRNMPVEETNLIWVVCFLSCSSILHCYVYPYIFIKATYSSLSSSVIYKRWICRSATNWCLTLTYHCKRNSVHSDTLSNEKWGVMPAHGNPLVYFMHLLNEIINTVFQQYTSSSTHYLGLPQIHYIDSNSWLS